jgi:hypothetical protein
MAETVVFQIVVETPHCSNPTCTQDVHLVLVLFFQNLEHMSYISMLQLPVSAPLVIHELIGMFTSLHTSIVTVCNLVFSDDHPVPKELSA